jgi:endonuclease YncB( thermonuclease family)
MFLNKKNLYLVIKFFIIFFSTIFLIEASEVKIIDGDTIHINKDKIRFSGIDAPELNQTCLSNNQVIKCGHSLKRTLNKKDC